MKNKNNGSPSLSEQGFHPISIAEAREGVRRTLTEDGRGENNQLERITHIKVTHGFSNDELLTDDLRALISMSGSELLMSELGVDPEFHVRLITERALERSPDRVDLLDRFDRLVSRFSNWNEDRRERTAQHEIELAEWEATREHEANNARAVRKLEIEAAEAQELVDVVAIDDSAMRRVRAEESQEPLAKRAVQAIKRVIAPQRSETQFERKVERTKEDYLEYANEDGPIRTEVSMWGRKRVVGGTLRQRMAAAHRLRIHEQAFGDDDGDERIS